MLSDSSESGLRELLVDASIGWPGLDVEHSSVRHGVEQWPEGGVAASIVELVKHEAGVQGHGDNVWWPETCGGSEVIRTWFRDGVCSIVVVLETSPAHPETITLNHHRGHSSHQAPSTDIIKKF